MKARILKIFFCSVTLLFGLSQIVFGQQGESSASDYYYNYFDGGALGSAWSPTTPPNLTVKNTNLDIYNSATGYCLSTITNTASDISGALLPATTDMTQEDYEWNLLYKCSATPTATVSTRTTLTTANNAWRYWLFASSTSLSGSTTSGCYLTEGSDQFLYVYEQPNNGGSSSQILKSNIKITPGTTYCIKVQRLGVNGALKLYLDAYAPTVTSAKTLQNSGVHSGANNVSGTYTTSVLETSEKSGATADMFQFDDMDMYEMEFQFISDNTDLTPSPIVAGQPNVVAGAYQILMRGNYEFSSISVSETPGAANFLNAEYLYKSLDNLFTFAAPDTLKATGGGYGYIGAITGNDYYNSIGNPTTGALTSVGYYYLGGTVKSSISSGTLTYAGINQIQTKDYGGVPKYTGYSPTSSPATTVTFGQTYDWNGSVTGGFWNNTSNWTPHTVPTSNDLARIGSSISYTNSPVVSGTASVGGIQFGNKNASNLLTVNAALTVGGSVTQTTSTAVTIAGSNTLKINGALSITPAFTNSATVDLTGSTSASVITGAFNNTGTVKTGTGSLTISAITNTNSGTLSTAGGTINLSCTQFINSVTTGIITVNTSGTLNVNGQLLQQNTMTIGTSGSPGTLDVGTGGALQTSSGTNTIGPNSTINLTGNGSIQNSTTFTLQSDATGTATVGKITGTGTITGNISVQRYVTGGSGYRGYRLFSSPINISSKTDQTGSNIAYIDPTYLNAGMLTGGPSGGGFDATTTNPLMYLYDESRASNILTFVGGKNVGISKIVGSPTYTVTAQDITNHALTAQQVPVGNSFQVYFVGTTSLSNTSPEAATVTATGTINQGTIPMWLFKPGAAPSATLSKSGTGAVVQGLNQVGNPYPSTINLDVVASENAGTNGITGVFYELNQPGGTYLSYTTGGSSSTRQSKYVVSGQGFFVVAKTNSSTLTFNEDQKVAYPANFTTLTSPGMLMSIPPTHSLSKSDVPAQMNQNLAAQAPTSVSASVSTSALTGLHLQLTKDSINNTQTGIYFNSTATDKFDEGNDAIDLDGTAPKVYLSSFSSDGVRLCVNKLSDYTKGKRIKLFAKATTSGLYTISLADIQNIDTGIYNIYLVDNLNRDSLDIVRYNSYAFNINTTDTTTFGANRFVLVFEPKPLPQYQLVDFSGQKVTAGVQLSWKAQNAGDYTGFILQKQDSSGNFNSLYTIQSDNSIAYSYVDQHPVIGNNIYRLEQNDINGNITYSAPITIGYNSTSPNSNLSIYPNPSKDIINITVPSNSISTSGYTESIYNTSGTLVSRQTVNANTWAQDVSSYKLGVYIIELTSTTGDLVGKGKFVKVN